MNLLKMNFKYVIILMASVALFSCSDGEDGMTGAIGPAGPTGQTGPDGPAGADGQDGVDGTDGQDGNANVRVSDWFSFENSDWTVINSLARTIKDAPEITQDVIDNAIVLVYRRAIAPTEGVSPLPRYNGVFFTDFELRNVSEIRFTILRTDGNAFTSVSNSSNIQYKYAIIPPSTSTSGKSAIDFTKMTYEEVMDHFGLDY